jgi:PD-(D/E)XK nuclease superfamily
MIHQFEALSGQILEAAVDVHGALAQLKSYLKATHLHTGLLLNFNAPTLVVKRVVL